MLLNNSVQLLEVEITHRQLNGLMSWINYHPTTSKMLDVLFQLYLKYLAHLLKNRNVLLLNGLTLNIVQLVYFTFPPLHPYTSYTPCMKNNTLSSMASKSHCIPNAHISLKSLKNLYIRMIHYRMSCNILRKKIKHIAYVAICPGLFLVPV